MASNVKPDQREPEGENLLTIKTEIEALQAKDTSLDDDVADLDGARYVTLCHTGLDIVAASAAQARFVAPIGGTVDRIYSVTNSALAGGDATLTANINGTAITTGVVTITQAASAVGDVDSTTPTAANTVAAGQRISVVCGGANTEVGSTANVFVRIKLATALT